jgi:autotransporter-associated beta strand protein
MTVEGAGMARGRFFYSGLVLTLVFRLTPVASAETYTWTGAVGDSWSQQVGSQTNWADNVIPPSASTTDLVFGASATGVAINDLPGPFVLHSMAFGGDAFQLSGGALTFAGSDGGASILQNSPNTQDLSLGLQLNVPTTIGGTGTGTVVLRGTVTGTSLTATVPIDLETGGITLSGSQAYTAGLRFGTTTAVSLRSTGGGEIALGGAVDGGAALTLNTSGVTRLGGVIGGVTAPASLLVSGQGTTLLDGGQVRTTGAQTYYTQVLLRADTSLAASNVTFLAALNGPASLTVTDGTTRFSAPAGAATPLKSVNLGDTTVTDSVTTVGGQFYGKLRTGNSEVALKSLGGGDIVMTSVDTGTPLTVSTSGVTRFVGSTQRLGAVTTDAPGNTTLEGAISASGLVKFNDPVTLSGDATLSSGSYDTTFAEPIDGDASFEFSYGGKLILSAPVGHTVALKRFATSGASGRVQFAAGSVTTSADQAYPGLVLQGDALLTSTGGGTISVGQVIGNFALAVNTAGTTKLSIIGDTTAVASVTTDATGSTTIGNGVVRTSGPQTFNDPVTLTSSTGIVTFSSTGGGDIAFNGGLTGSGKGLAINTSGVTTLAGPPAGAPGGTFASVTTDVPGMTRLAGGTITATGNQTYNETVRVIAATTLGGPATKFGNSVDGPGGLSVNGNSTYSTVTFNGPVGATTPLGSLVVSGTSTVLNCATVTTVGDQSYDQAVTLTRPTTFTSTGGGNLSFATLGAAGSYGVTLNTSGVTSIAGNASSLTTDAPGTTLLRGNVNTAGPQTYNDPVTLAAKLAVTSQSNTGDIRFGSSLDGAYDLTVGTIPSRRAVFAGPVGDVTPLKSLYVGYGSAEIDGGGIKATDGISFYGPVTLGAPTTLAASGTSGSITLARTVDGAFPLVLNSAGGKLVLASLGTTTPLTSLTTAPDGTTTLVDGSSSSVSIRTTGSQTYNNPVFASAFVALTSLGGDVTFAGVVQANYDIVINAGGRVGMADVSLAKGMLQVTNGKDSAITGVVSGINGVAKAGGDGALTLSAANTYTGPTEVTAGRLRVTGSISASSGVRVSAGGTFEAAAPQQLHTLTIDPAGLAVVTGGTLKIGDGTLATPLTLTTATDTAAGSTMDLVDHALVVQPSADARSFTLDTVRSLIASAFDGGRWDGAGITSSTAKADPRRAIGYALASEVLAFPDTDSTDFLGQPVNEVSTVARVTLSGDANLDGAVNFEDLVALAQNYNTTAPAAGSGQSGWVHGDFNYDGSIDFADLVKLAQNYNTDLNPAAQSITNAPPGFESDLAAAFASVPEPSGLAAIAIAGIARAVSRRRRRP